MSDIAQVIDYPNTVISVASYECIGVDGYGLSGGSTYNTLAAWPSANLAIFIPLKLGYNFTVANALWVNGATVGTNNVDVGIYDSQGNRLVHSGNILTAGVNVMQSTSLSLTLTPGFYYLAITIDGTTDTVKRLPNATNVQAFRAGGVLQQAAASPLPTTATMVGLTFGYVPYLAISSSATL